jgi:hypothetical protein
VALSPKAMLFSGCVMDPRFKTELNTLCSQIIGTSQWTECVAIVQGLGCRTGYDCRIINFDTSALYLRLICLSIRQKEDLRG